MSWEPGVPLSQRGPTFRVGATDAEDVGDSCALRTALKCRPATFVETGSWRKRSGPFALGMLVEAVKDVHRRIARGGSIEDALRLGKATLASQHPGIRTYLHHALDNYFDYHESREALMGPLRLIDHWPIAEKAPNVSIAAWGPLYEAADGTRELRRLRVGRAREDRTVWLPFAAHVAGLAVGEYQPTRVFVVELGLYDGSEQQLVAGMAVRDAEEWWEREGRPVARAATTGTTRLTGSGCADCKATAVCPELVTVSGALQVAGPGAWLRTVSATDLSVYAECPARWFLERDQHLPADREGNAGLLRGTAVHKWLEWAHARNTACTHEDLPNPTEVTIAQLTEWGIEQQDYSEAFPYLFTHVDTCPLLGRSLEPVASEETLFVYDPQADVVPVVKPDALWRVGTTLIAREYKSTDEPLPQDSDVARDRFGNLVPWLLVLLQGGLAERFACDDAVVELEVLTREGSAVYSFRTDDAVLMTLARRRVKSLTEAWHSDTTFATRIGPHCERCPVRAWCPERDSYATRSPVGLGAPIDPDQPPF